MTYFRDLTPYIYSEDLRIETDFGHIRCRPRFAVLNVGWLDAPHEYPTGPLPAGFLDALAAIIAGPHMNPYRGVHLCTLCPSPMGFEELDVEHAGRSLRLGYSEIRVPSGPWLLAAPTLIWHYLTVHGYRPPDAFIEGVHNYDPDWPDGPWVPADAERHDWGPR